MHSHPTRYSVNRLRLLYRIPWMFWTFCIATVEAGVLYARHGTRMDGARWVQRQTRRLLRIADISFTTSGTPPAAGELVSNHVSYVDILVTSTAVPCVFVAKKEVREIIWLGWLSDIAGTIFIDRGKSSQAAAEEVGKVLAEGALVAFYPEGTTSDGTRLRRFRAALFAPAVEQGRMVTPAAIRYRLPGGDAHTEIAFTGDQQMAPHIIHLLSMRGGQAHLQFGQPFDARDGSAAKDPVRGAALRAQQAVADMLDVTAEAEATALPV